MLIITYYKNLMSVFRRVASRKYFATGLILILAGCGGNSDMGKVKGRVTLDGTPFEGAVVEFQPVPAVVS